MASLQTRKSGAAWVLLDHAATQPVAPGDLISADAGGMPIYRVAGLAQGQVLVEDARSRRRMPIGLFMWKLSVGEARA